MKLYIYTEEKTYTVRFNLNYCVYRLFPCFYRYILYYDLRRCLFSFYRDCYQKTPDVFKKKKSTYINPCNDLPCPHVTNSFVDNMYTVIYYVKRNDMACTVPDEFQSCVYYVCMYSSLSDSVLVFFFYIIYT